MTFLGMSWTFDTIMQDGSPGAPILDQADERPMRRSALGPLKRRGVRDHSRSELAVRRDVRRVAPVPRAGSMSLPRPTGLAVYAGSCSADRRDLLRRTTAISDRSAIPPVIGSGTGAKSAL